MKYEIALIFLFFPLVANSGCKMSVNGNLMTLYVGKEDLCLKNTEDRNLFKSLVNKGLVNSEVTNLNTAKETITKQRKKTEEKNMLVPDFKYYGQK